MGRGREGEVGWEATNTMGGGREGGRTREREKIQGVFGVVGGGGGGEEGEVGKERSGG